jgi:hypothetical protein
MSELQVLHPYIKPYVIGCPEAAIDAEMVLAAKVLAKKTLSFRDSLWLDSQSNWGVYHLEFPKGHNLESVTRVCVNGFNLGALVEKPCDGCSGDIGFYVDRNKVLHIYPAPSRDEEQGIEVEYAYSPSLASCDIDADIIERYADDIVAGVLSRLLLMYGQKWYDPKLAMFYDAKWKQSQVSALVDGSSPYTNGTISISNQHSMDYLDS